MNTHENADSALKKIFRFIVLVPHRDSRLLLEEYSAVLFRHGTAGARAFPVSAPLALVSRSFNRDELKALAHELRYMSLQTDGRISAGSAALLGCPGGIPFPDFFGPLLDLGSPESMEALKNEKLLYPFSKTLLCAALLGPDAKAPSVPCQPLSFRAASVSNLAIRQLEENPYSYEWRLGPLCWLPAYRRP